MVEGCCDDDVVEGRRDDVVVEGRRDDAVVDGRRSDDAPKGNPGGASMVEGPRGDALPVDSHVDIDRDEAMAMSPHRLHDPSM
ncbi:unnamed protein product, partial [Urochloa humidicola]